MVVEADSARRRCRAQARAACRTGLQHGGVGSRGPRQQAPEADAGEEILLPSRDDCRPRGRVRRVPDGAHGRYSSHHLHVGEEGADVRVADDQGLVHGPHRIPLVADRRMERQSHPGPHDQSHAGAGLAQRETPACESHAVCAPPSAGREGGCEIRRGACAIYVEIAGFDWYDSARDSGDDWVPILQEDMRVLTAKRDLEDIYMCVCGRVCKEPFTTNPELSRL